MKNPVYVWYGFIPVPGYGVSGYRYGYGNSYAVRGRPVNYPSLYTDLYGYVSYHRATIELYSTKVSYQGYESSDTLLGNYIANPFCR
jgi:hypothetical protein